MEHQAAYEEQKAEVRDPHEGTAGISWAKTDDVIDRVFAPQQAYKAKEE